MRFAVKMMLGFLLILSLTYGVGGSLLIYVSFSQSLSRAEETAMSSQQMLMYTLAELGGDSSASDNYAGAADAAALLDDQNAAGWLALRLSDSDGGMVYLSPAASVQPGVPFQDGSILSCDLTHRSQVIFKDDSDRYLLQIAGQFGTKDGVLCIEAVYDISSVYEARGSQLELYRQLFAAVVALGTALAWVLSHFLTQPLRKLSGAARTLTSGDLSCRVEICGRDEIGRLGSDFNRMADRLEENIEELREAMRRQEEFMGGFAHELKTPLTSVIGYSDLLRRGGLSEPESMEAANTIFSEGRRLESLSLKLLDLLVMKHQELPLTAVSPGQLVAQAAELMWPILEKDHIKLRTRCDGGIALLEPDLVMSLLVNLVDNARKAMIRNSGGEIFVESKTDSDHCIIRVADNGRGIPPEELARLTDAFYRVDKSRSRAQGGVGLGLTLCREIAALHGGTISFESVPGKGTCVTVVLKGGAVPHET